MSGWAADIGWRGKVGLIATPAIDNSHIELMRVAPDGVAAYQTVPHVAGFRVRAGDILRAAEQLKNCAQALSAGGMDVIGQAGTPFSFAHDDGLKWALGMHAHLEEVAQKPVTMMGLSILEALEACGYESVAVASTYYSEDLCGRYTRFLQDAGFHVLAMQNWVQQGLLPDKGLLEQPRLWYPHSLAYQGARAVAESAPEADCILLTGGAVHTMDIIAALEDDLQKPVITSDSAFFWSLLRKLGVRERLEGWGDLLSRLSSGV
jgi:maleate cis-trans isomerase